MAETSYERTETFAALLADPDIAPMFYVLISGIPYAFGNMGIPEAWDTGGGVVSIDSEDYTWSQTLIVREDFGGLSQKAEPKRGFGTAGGQTFEFKLTGTDAPEDDLWFSLLLKNLHRTDKAATNLNADLDADTTGGAATITVVDASDFATSAQSVYIGTETITVGSVSNTSTTLHNIARRGAYKSWAQAHRVTTDPTREATAGGPYVATWPLVWEGRVVRLYMALGQWVSGTWRPYRDTSGDPVTQEVYAGLIMGVREGGDTLSINIETASIDQLLANKVGARLPRAPVAQYLQAGQGGVIHVGPHNWWLSWEWIANDVSAAATAAEESLLVLNKRLHNGGAEVTEDLYPIQSVYAWIATTIKQYGIPQSTVSTEAFADTPVISDTNDYRARLQLWFQSTNIDDYDLHFHIEGTSKPSILRDLGWTGTFQMEEVARSANSLVLRADSNEAPPAFRWPALDKPLPTRLYHEPIPTDGLDFVTSPGWVTDGNATIPAAVLIDKAKEIITVLGSGSTTIGNTSYPYLTIGARGIYNTGQYKDYVLKYDPYSDKSCEIVQGIYLPDVSLDRALLYLWHSGSGAAGTMHATWDKGWESSGLALPSDFIDIDEITSVADDIKPARDQIWIGEEIELRRWLESELLLEQVMMLARADFDAGTGYKLTWVRTIPPPLYTSNTTERALDHTRLKTDLGGNGVQIDRQENKLINAVTVRCAYNHATKKYGTTIDQNHVTSQQVWGVRERITLDVKTISGLADAQQLAVALAKRVFDRYAHPYDITEVDAAYAPTWAWQIGDIVALTHEALPAIDSPGRGWTAEGTRLYVKKDNLTGAGGVSSRLTLVRGGSMGARQTVIAPSALLTSDASGGARTTWNVAEHEFSASTDAIDLSYFQAGFYVQLWLRGTTLTANYTVDSVDTAAGTVTFTGTVGGALGSGGDIVMMLAAYGNISGSGSADQKKFAHMSDFTGAISDGATNDRPYKYF